MRGRVRRRRGWVLGLVGGCAVVAIVALAFIYFVLFPTSSPKTLRIATTGAAAPIRKGSSLAGRWTIAAGSVAGYRVREKLGFLPAESDAVGRTSQITGHTTVTQSGSAVTFSAASFRVAVNTLKSNEAMRDQHIRTIGLQSDRYPTATFVLSRPLTLPASALSGRVVAVPVTGLFTIHGVSRSETLPLQVALGTSTIRAAGSLTFPWGRFGMTAPSVGGFVNVTAHATMEFELRLTRE